MKFLPLFIALLLALVCRFYGVSLLEESNPTWIRLLSSLVILAVGAFYILRKTANVIEETTEVLSHRTKLAGGLLQSFGTAFPDMVLGIVAALTSLSYQSSNPTAAINFAIIAAATTFGSNIYNIGYTAWCAFRQNQTNESAKKLALFPFLPNGPRLTPMQDHKNKASKKELQVGMTVSTGLSILTGLVALSMVLFGRVENAPINFSSDIYQLVKPMGIFGLLASIAILYYFRKTERGESPLKEIQEAEHYFAKKSTAMICGMLAISAVIILLGAESMVHAIQVFCEITGLPFVIAGALAGIIGCLGEIIVIHNYFVNPQGRIGDGIVGVAMDNIVTIMGASIVAVMGGIFLGGNALIVIFVIIFMLNTVLLLETSKLKEYCR